MNRLQGDGWAGVRRLPAGPARPCPALGPWLLPFRSRTRSDDPPSLSSRPAGGGGAAQRGDGMGDSCAGTAWGIAAWGSRALVRVVSKWLILSEEEERAACVALQGVRTCKCKRGLEVPLLTGGRCLRNPQLSRPVSYTAFSVVYPILQTRSYHWCNVQSIQSTEMVALSDCKRCESVPRIHS